MDEYFKNPRTLTERQAKLLEQSLRTNGDLSGIIHDLNTDQLAGGNMRSRIIDINKCEIELIEKYDQPDEQGTVAWGFVIWEGKRYNYRQVRWSPEQMEVANIAANKMGGEFDYDILANEFDTDTLQAGGFEDWEIGEVFADFDEDDNYSRNIEPPIYEPNNVKPAIDQLYDSRKAEELSREIDEADIPDDEKRFLRIAAQRHTVFNFSKIADYYAHSNERIQSLMEHSALVIIDFKQAVELGFVRLTEELLKYTDDE